MVKRRQRFLRVIVALGAAGAIVTGCSSNEEPTAPSDSNSAGKGSGGSSAASSGGSGGTAGTGALSGGAAGAETAGAGGEAGNGEGGGTALGPCEFDQQYLCASLDDCYCDPLAPLSAEDCEDGSEFSCMSYEPPTGCSCLP